MSQLPPRSLEWSSGYCLQTNYSSFNHMNMRYLLFFSTVAIFVSACSDVAGKREQRVKTNAPTANSIQTLVVNNDSTHTLFLPLYGQTVITFDSNRYNPDTKTAYGTVVFGTTETNNFTRDNNGLPQGNVTSVNASASYHCTGGSYAELTLDNFSYPYQIKKIVGYGYILLYINVNKYVMNLRFSTSSTGSCKSISVYADSTENLSGKTQDPAPYMSISTATDEDTPL